MLYVSINGVTQAAKAGEPGPLSWAWGVSDGDRPYWDDTAFGMGDLGVGAPESFKGSFLDMVVVGGPGVGDAMDMADLTALNAACGNLPPGEIPPDLRENLGPNDSLRNKELCRGCAGDPVDTLSGNFFEPVPGISVAGRGPGLSVGFQYNSTPGATDPVDGGAGFGWSPSFAMRLERTVDGRLTVVQEGGATVPFLPDGSGGWVPSAKYVAALQKNGDGSYTFTRHRSQRFTFEAPPSPTTADATIGRLRELSDLFGNVTHVHYPSGSSLQADALYQGSSLSGAGAQRLDISWAAGRIASVSDQLPSGQGGPRSLTLSYTGGDLTGYTDAMGGQWVFGYDAHHRMTSLRKPRHSDPSKVIENHYDAQGRVDWQEDELDRRSIIAYDTPVAGKTTVTGPGTSPIVRVDTFIDGRRENTTIAPGTPDAVSQSFTFDPTTYALVSSSLNGATTSYGHDATGNTTSVEDPTGRIQRFTYNALDQVLTASIGEIRTSPTTTSTAAVVTTTNEYDASNGRLEKSTVAAGTSEAAVTDYVYGDGSHLEDVTKVVDSRGKEWLSGYDADTGYQVWSQDPEGGRTVRSFNEVGWPLSVTSPRGVATTAVAHDFETTYSYDVANRKTTVTGPVADPGSETGDVTVTVLDANGNTAAVTTGTGSGDTTIYGYDAADEVTVVDPPGPGAKGYEYFPSGTLKRYSNELGGHWDYGYDAAGRTVTEADPLGRTTTYGYDAAGRVATVRQPVAGATCTGTKVGCITYYRDAAGRLTGIDYSANDLPDVSVSGDFTQGIRYDALGRRIGQTLFGSGNASEEWTWNRRSQLVSHRDRSQRTTTFGWDKTGNMTAIRYPGTTADVVRHFDGAGRLDSVTDYAGRTVSFGYDADSNWTGTSFPGPSGTANTDAFGFDGAGRMISATWRQGGPTDTVLGSETYARPTSSKGMVASTTMTGTAGAGSKTNSYDARDRLTAAGTEAFGIDDAGNLTTMADAIHQTFDAAQQMCWSSPTDTTGTCGSTKPADATVYSYDAKGNRTSQQAPGESPTLLGYNQANQLISARVGSGQVADGDLVAVTPTRIVDTRDGTGGCPVAACARMSAGQSMQTPLANAGGVLPSGGFSAVLVTVTVINPAADGYLAVAGNGNAAAATLNYQAGVERSITAIVPAGTYLGLFTTKATDVVIDVSGYFRGTGAVSDAYRAVTPARLVDTRTGTGTCDGNPCAITTAGATTLITAAGNAGLPGSGMHAAVATVTVVNPAADGTLVVAPTTSTGGPGAGRITYTAGVTTNASVIAPVDANGKIALYTSNAVDVVVDVSGYFTAPADGDLGLGLHTVAVTRLVKSSTPTGPCVGGACATLAAGTRQKVQVTGNAGIPTGAKAVYGTLTLTGTGSSAGYVQINPSGTSGMGASAEQSVEYPASGVVNAAVLVPLNDDGTLEIVSSTAAGHWMFDVAGYLSQHQGNWTYTYNADGIRSTKKSPGGTVTQFTWTDGNGLPLLLSQRTQTSPGGTTWDETRIIYGPGGQPIEQIAPDGTAVWLHHDQLGSVRMSTAAAGSNPGEEVSSRSFNAYGTVRSKTGPQPLLGYAGQYTDNETGYQYLRARYYDGKSGQFVSQDPLGELTRSPYSYSTNPVTQTDPSGMCNGLAGETREEYCRELAAEIAREDADRAFRHCVMNGGSIEQCEDISQGVYDSTYGIWFASCMDGKMPDPFAARPPTTEEVLNGDVARGWTSSHETPSDVDGFDPIPHVSIPPIGKKLLVAAGIALLSIASAATDPRNLLNS